MDLISSKLTADDLMVQAPDTVNFYLRLAIEHIEDNFGEGYAKEHPELLAGFIQACAADFHTGIQAKSLGAISDAIIAVAEQLNEITRIVGTITSMNEGGNNA